MFNDLKYRIDTARGLKKADLVLKGGRLVNVASGEIYRTDIAIASGKIAGLGSYDGKKVIDVSSKFILPGLIDSHVHIESSLLAPAAFAKIALPHGTTAVIADPHEIANVLGKKGINFMLKTSEDLLLDFFFMLPSCVPATPLETSGAKLTAADLLPFLKHKRVLGLAEMMNYPGVLSKDPGVVRKLSTFSESVIDGHAPGLSGRDLCAYVGAGISSDHECVTAKEAREKVRLGMAVLVREGSSAKDLEALLPAISPSNSRLFCFATDDFQARDLLEGSINQLIRKAVKLGLHPVTAVQMATINPARHYNLRYKGAVLPGYDADIVVIDSFDTCKAEMVFKAGKLVAKDGTCIASCKSRYHENAMGTVRTGTIEKQDLLIKARSSRARVIELVPDQIETKQAILQVSAQNGFVTSDVSRDILKLIVFERHRATGNTGVGLVKGLGLRSGALAGTVAHDSHNIIAVGTNDDDILSAVSRLSRIHGGFVVVNRGKVLAELPLPIAGLMSDRPASFVSKALGNINRAAKRLGIGIDHPFGTLSFLALPVVPELKLTDRGLVDVNKFALVDLFV